MFSSLLAPKAICAIATGCSACVGGGVIYWWQLPRTWRELFQKEGLILLNGADQYKGIYEDQKDHSPWKDTEELKGSTKDNAHTKVHDYCNKQLNSKLPSDPDYNTTKERLTKLCTTQGIVTVKGNLEQNGRSGWISGTNAESQYKTIFAVYRHHNEFISWLKKSNAETNKDLSETSTVNDNYTKLKTACETLLAKEHKNLQNQKQYQYITWWCIPLTETTIQNRIKAKHEGWTKEDNGQTIMNTWKDTSTVTDQIKSDLNKNDSDLTGDDYKKWCDDHLAKDLSEENSYKKKYLLLLSVCKKKTTEQ